MLNYEAFTAVRGAATLCHSVPALRIRIRAEGRTLIDVAPQGTPMSGEPQSWVTPCGFRTAVARAWEAQGRGEHLSLIGLPPGVDPTVEIGVPPCGQRFPGDIYRVPLGHRDLYVLASSLPGDVLHEEATALAEERDPAPGSWGIGLRMDSATGIGLAYCELDQGRRAAGEPAVLDILHALLGRLAVRHLTDDMTTSNPR